MRSRQVAYFDVGYRGKAFSPVRRRQKHQRCRLLLFDRLRVGGLRHGQNRQPLFLPLFDSLIQRLENSRVHRRDDIDRRVQFFFGHAGFPCVRKAALHSRIAKPHHRHGEAHEHLFALREASYRVRIPVECPEISFGHRISFQCFYVRGPAYRALILLFMGQERQNPQAWRRRQGCDRG
jgi:hypothetical protein